MRQGGRRDGGAELFGTGRRSRQRRAATGRAACPRQLVRPGALRPAVPRDGARRRRTGARADCPATGATPASVRSRRRGAAGDGRRTGQLTAARRPGAPVAAEVPVALRRQRRVQRRWRNALGGLGRAHHDPVARRDPAPGARCRGRESCRDRGPPRPARARPAPRARRVRALPSAAAAPGSSRGRCPVDRTARRQSVDSHKVVPRPTPSEPMTSTTNGTLATRVRGFSSIDASLTTIRSRSGGRTTLGAFAFRAFARALAWLAFLAGAGPPVGRGIGLVCGRRAARALLARRLAPRWRVAAGDAGRCVRLRRRSSLRRAPVLTAWPASAFIAYPPTFSSARSRTDALRGFSAISSAPARSAPRVKATNSGSWPGNSTGRPGGVREAVAAANMRS